MNPILVLTSINALIDGADAPALRETGTGADQKVLGLVSGGVTVYDGSDVISETTTVVTEIDSVSSSVTWTLGSYLEKLTLTGSAALRAPATRARLPTRWWPRRRPAPPRPCTRLLATTCRAHPS